MESIFQEIWYYVFRYLILYHPVYWLYNKAWEYEPLQLDTGIWLATAVFGIAAWFALTRFVAEVPGRRHGNMFFWWIFFSIFHVWGLPVYLLYDLVASITRKHRQDFLKDKYSDRSRAEIFAEGKRRKRRR